VCVCVCSNVVDLSSVTAGAGIDALVSPSQVSHDCVTTTPIYEHCGPPTSSPATSTAERPVPRPRSTYGKYYLENLKNINTESKPASANSPSDSSDYVDNDDDAFCQ